MLTFTEVCGRLRVTPKTLRKLILAGDLKAIRVGGNGAYRVSEEDLTAYIKRQAVEANA